MPIIKSTRADNGVTVSYHKATRLEVNLANNTATVQVQSHADEASATAKLPVVWNWTLSVSVATLSGVNANILDAVENALIGVGGAFEGGELTLDRTASLEVLKERKRAEITAARLKADAGFFSYKYTTTVNVPATDISEATTQEVVMSKDIRTADKDMFDLLATDARMQKGWPANWPGGWKAIDNTYLPISNKQEWDKFFIAAYDAGVQNFQHSQELKMLLDAASNAEQVAAIVW